MKLPVLCLVVVLTASGCSTARFAGTESADRIVREKAAVFSLAVTAASASGWSAESVARLVDLYTPDATIFPPKGATLKGREALLAYWTRPATNRILAHRVDVEHAEMSGNLLFEYGRFTLTYQAADSDPQENTAQYVSVWRRGTDGQWKKHLDSWW